MKMPARFTRFTILMVIVLWPTLLLQLPEARAIKRDKPVEAASRPEAVLITAKSAKDRKEAFCSGTLIADNVVLTAAHCAEGFDTWEVTAPYAKNGPARAVARSAKIHPDYRARVAENDVALLILDSEIDIGGKFPKIHEGDLLPLGSKLLIVGRVDNGKVSRDKMFESGDVTIVEDQVNVNVYGGNPPVVQKGDSGGPVYTATRDAEIVGVVSGYIDFSGEPVPTDLFAPLGKKKRDWIREVLREAKREKEEKK